MKSLQQLELEIKEMWDAIYDIPNDDPGKQAAWDEAEKIETRMRREWQEKYAEGLLTTIAQRWEYDDRKSEEARKSLWDTIKVLQNNKR